jgi:hypothetical protein
MKIIFLDIDGVLNCEEAYLKGECRYLEWEYECGKKDHHQRFCTWSKNLLNELIRKTGAKIVISSTWRKGGLDYMKKIWEVEEMEGEIIGLTPSLYHNDVTIPRGVEIKLHLDKLGFRHINWSSDEQMKYMKESEVENYIIIDDDSDMLYQQRNHFVHVLPSPRNKFGFNEESYIIALEKLSKNVIDLNYNLI